MQVRAGRGMSLRETLYGFAPSASPRGTWKHPWFITPRWSSGRWSAQVKPGLVNAFAPVVRTTVEEQQEIGAQRDFGINPLSGVPFFSDPIFDHPTQPVPAAKRIIDIPLYLDPAVALTLSPLGWDGPGDGAVPQFFLDRGVARSPRPSGGSGDPEDGVTVEFTEPPANLRLLRACDVWVHQPRLALTSSIEVAEVFGELSNVTQTLGVRSQVAGDALRVFAGRFTRQPITIDPTQSDYEEQAWDDLLIGTVFLLSPPRTPVGSAPDGTWQPFVRHHLFWNLSWVPGTFQPLSTDHSTIYIPPLAGGAAQLIINFLIASLNDLTQTAINNLTAHSLAGTFYTATGGGHEAAVADPAPTVAVGSTGFDWKGRASARAVRTQRTRRAVQLDPPFPYRAEPFDTALLSFRPSAEED